MTIRLVKLVDGEWVAKVRWEPNREQLKQFVDPIRKGQRNSWYYRPFSPELGVTTAMDPQVMEMFRNLAEDPDLWVDLTDVDLGGEG